jgi:SAM-dependent methyltransferase
MNDLEKYFRLNDKRLIHKWKHYFDVYDRHFSKYRNKDIVILEIGVSQGGSLQMWKDYFGDGVKIFGIDINPQCKELEEENIKIFIGSQSDRKFLRDVKSQIPLIDILIDDGGHTMVQQIVSYQELFSYVKEDGVYLCEDLHTSYWLEHGGGYKRRGTFIEYSKNFIDSINAYHSRQKNLKVDEFTKSVFSIHYYDSILVIEKRPMEKPYHEKTGTPSFVPISTPETLFLKIIKKSAPRIILKTINKTLRFFRLGGFIWK